MECEYFKDESNYGDLIAETDYWVILLAPDQRYLGTCVVALKRFDGDLGGLTDEEWLDFGLIVKNLEAAIRKSFKSVLFNWGCLMNSSYLNDPPNPHVHWHLIPRYKNKTEFEDFIFEDPCFGSSTMKTNGVTSKVPEDVRWKIIKKIKDNLKKTVVKGDIK